jgi:hypothetical protein
MVILCFRRLYDLLKASSKVLNVFALFFLTKSEYFKRVFIKLPVSNFTEIRPVGIALIHVDRRKDMKLISEFYECAKAPISTRFQTHHL